MSTRSVLKLSNWIVCLPLKMLGRFLICANAYSIRDDFDRCIYEIDRANPLPIKCISLLIAAEDHRNSFHFGVDPYGVIRAIVLFVLQGKRQGASTIEQQFVRVVTRRYELTARRKFREQILAVAICSCRSKRRIAEAYLGLAFYGVEKWGYAAIQNYIQDSKLDVVRLIASLRYPEPAVVSSAWLEKINLREGYIKTRMSLYGLVDSE